MRPESRPPGLPASMRIDSPLGVTISVAAPPSTSDQITSRRPSFLPAKIESEQAMTAASKDFMPPMKTDSADLDYYEKLKVLTAAMFVFLAGTARALIVAPDLRTTAFWLLLGRFLRGF